MFNKDEFILRLKYLNEKLNNIGHKVNLYLAGGMAIAFHAYETRVTLDADIFNNKIQKNIITLLNQYDINTEISKIIKDDSYLEYSKLHPISSELSNINLYIVNPSYLFVLKNLAQISPNRSIEAKEIDLEDSQKLIKLVSFEEVWEIIEKISKKSIDQVTKKYLIKEVEKWIK